MNKKGFLLFEIVVSIVIITAGLLFIMRSFSSSKDSMQISTELFKESLLAENKMWDFEEKGEIERIEDSGDFEGDKGLSWQEGYSWQAEANPIGGDLELNQLTLTVFQKKDPKKTQYYIATYLKNE